MKTPEREVSGDSSDIVRATIDRENELINHRVTWLTTVQGLLFASLGFAWDKPNARTLIEVLCLLGGAISVIALLALVSATRAIARLLDWWEANKPRNYSGPGVIGQAPLKNTVVRLAAFWNWMPLMFLWAWAMIWRITAG